MARASRGRKVSLIKHPKPGNVLRVVKLAASGNRFKEQHILPSGDRMALYTRLMGGPPNFTTGVFVIDTVGGGLVAPEIETLLRYRRLRRPAFTATMAVPRDGVTLNHSANVAMWSHQIILGYPEGWITDQPDIRGDVYVEVPETWEKVTVRGRTRTQIEATLGTMTGKDGMLFDWGEYEYHTVYVRDPAKVSLIGLMI